MVTLTYALKINHTVFVSMLSRIQRSTHFFKQLLALPQTSGRLFITKTGPCTYARIHCLRFGKMSTNSRKKKRHSPIKLLQDWLETAGVTTTHNIYQRVKTHMTNTISSTRREQTPVAGCLRCADVTVDQHN